MSEWGPYGKTRPNILRQPLLGPNKKGVELTPPPSRRQSVAAPAQPNAAIAAMARAAIAASQELLAKIAEQRKHAPPPITAEERAERINYNVYGEEIGSILHRINKARKNGPWYTIGRNIRSPNLRISNTTRRQLAKTYLTKVRELHDDDRPISDENATNFLNSVGGARGRRTTRRASQPKRRTRKH